MVAISHVILLVGTATALVLPRDASKIQAHLKALNADYIALKQADEAYATGGSANDIQILVNKVEAGTKQATADTKASSCLSRADSQTIYEYISNTLEPSVGAAVKATVANQAQVAKAGLAGAVQDGQKQLQADTDTLGHALVAVTPTKTGVSKLKAAFKKIDDDFDEGIAAYS